MRIAIDFDGTIVEHEYPRIGKPAEGAVYWIKKWKEAGATIMLWTMRSGPYLQEAVHYCTLKGIEFDAVNSDKQDWTSSPKLYANVYIDDAAFGCPLKPTQSGRPVVDWNVVGSQVYQLLLAQNG